ncbi:MAG: hypothetical protein AAF560_03090 [Acidobacteriota bacterium]
MLDKHQIEAGEERNSRKQPLDDAGARELLSDVSTVIVVRGKKRREIAVSDVALDDLKGPTGNYRAPMVRSGDRLLVGFNVEALEELVVG